MKNPNASDKYLAYNLYSSFIILLFFFFFEVYIIYYNYKIKLIIIVEHTINYLIFLGTPEVGIFIFICLKKNFILKNIIILCRYYI